MQRQLANAHSTDGLIDTLSLEQTAFRLFHTVRGMRIDAHYLRLDFRKGTTDTRGYVAPDPQQQRNYCGA